MAQHFTKCIHMKPEDFQFTAKNTLVSVALANSLRRAMMSDIETYTIAPDTVKFVKNTSSWYPERLIHNIKFLGTKPAILEKKDLNMLEISLKVMGSGFNYRWVYAGEMIIQDKETKKEIPIEDIFVYPETPIFQLGPQQEVHFLASFEKMSKTDLLNKYKMVGKRYFSYHQASTVGYEYDPIIALSNKTRKPDPENITFSVGITTGLSPKNLVISGFEALILRFQNIQNSIKTKSKKVLVRMNKNHIYDFVISGETSTVGTLIETWVLRYDTGAFMGFRETSDFSTITLKFGLFKFIPEILQGTPVSNLEKAVKTSIDKLDLKQESKKREETISSFLSHLNRIEKYLETLKLDFKKVTFKTIPTKEYMEMIHKQRLISQSK